MGLHLERVPKVRAERGQREVGQRECKDRRAKGETHIRKPHPTLYPGEVEDENEECGEPGHQKRNMRGLTDRAKTNQHR
eukprot:5787379-Pleurochrysis_carterae.AAC.1